MCRSVRKDYAPPLPEDSVAAFCWLLLSFDWNTAELEECGVCQCDFHRHLRRLRDRLIGEGIMEEGG